MRGGLVLKAHRLLYHSTLGLRVIKKKKRRGWDLEVGVDRKPLGDEDQLRGGLVFKAHRLCVSLNSRLASKN